MNAPWTPARDPQLIQLVGRKLGAEEVARRMKVSGRTIRTHAARLGLKFHNTPGVWTKARDAQLKALAESGISAAAAGQQLGITRFAAIGRARVLGFKFTSVPGRARGRGKKLFVWNDAAFAELARLVEAGETSRNAAAKLGACVSGVQDHARRLGLVWKKSNYKNATNKGGAGRPFRVAVPGQNFSTAAAPVVRLSREDERGLILDFLAKKGARRFEPSATGDTFHLLDWLVRVCGRNARRLSSAGTGSSHRIYFIDGVRHDLAGLIAVVDEERRARGFEPISGEAA